jgi:hypothetical protein
MSRPSSDLIIQTAADYEDLEKWEEKGEGKDNIDKQEHAPYAFPEVSTKVEYDQNRRGTFAVYGASPHKHQHSPLFTPKRLPV